MNTNTECKNGGQKRTVKKRGKKGWKKGWKIKGRQNKVVIKNVKSYQGIIYRTYRQFAP